MNKFKILPIILTVIFFSLIAVIFLKARHNARLEHSLVLRHELRKGLNHLMIDLSRGHEAAIEQLPANGSWYKKRALIHTDHGALEYLMLLRRQYPQPGILEVRIEDPESLAMIYTFKLRTRP